MSTVAEMWGGLVSAVKLATGLTDVTVAKNRQGFYSAPAGKHCRIDIESIPESFVHTIEYETQPDLSNKKFKITRGIWRISFRFESRRNDPGEDAWELSSQWLGRADWEGVSALLAAVDLAQVEMGEAFNFDDQIDDHEISVSIILGLFSWSQKEEDITAEKATIGHVELTGFESDPDHEYTTIISEDD